MRLNKKEKAVYTVLARFMLYLTFFAVAYHVAQVQTVLIAVVATIYLLRRY